MNALWIFTILFLITSCGSISGHGPRDGKTVYSYTDTTGRYQLERETKKIKNKSITRTVLTESSGESKVLEKTITVAQLGSSKGATGRFTVVRPQASEFVVWLEGKKYESKMKIDSKKKAMILSFDGPENKWKGSQEVSFPSGKKFCFFSQIAECLYYSHLLTQAHSTPSKSFNFYIVWDSFPFTQEQYSRAGKKMFSSAKIRFEMVDRGLLRFLVSVDGESILYHFSKSFDLAKISWIAEGITVAPINEAENVDE